MAAKEIEIAYGMRSRHAEAGAMDGAREGARDDAKTPNTTIENGAKTALVEVPNLEPHVAFRTLL